MFFIRFLFLSSLFTFANISHASDLFDWTSTNIQVLTGGTYEFGPERRNSITIEHANGWAYGDNFAFIDIINRHDIGTELYGEFYPRLSWSKITGKKPAISMFKDFSLVAGINLANQPKRDPFKAYLLGGGIQFNVPKMDFFQIDVFAFRSEETHSTGIQISPVWSVPFQIGSLHFKFKGFADWQSAKASGGASYLLAQPQLLLDVGQLAGHADHVYAGIEYAYWHNKFGVKGVTEKVTQAMLMITF